MTQTVATISVTLQVLHIAMATYLEQKGIHLLPTFENLLQIPEIHKDIDNQVWIVDDKVAKSTKLPVKHLYIVHSGEKLKDLDHFSQHIKKILHLCENISTKKLKIVAVGGGSVGDFAGFVASILRRGVGLIQIPSTWLACVDSAHGGKTALNVDVYKNQIGTFYPAHKIFLIKDLLESQPPGLKEDAYAELFKIALLRGEKWFSNLISDIPKIKSEASVFWDYLLLAIAAKYSYIEEDPKEILGIRTELNLGHTLAHILENNCGLSHGKAVGKGLHFALRWSHHKGYISDSSEIQNALEALGHKRDPIKIKEKQIHAGLARDKKLTDRDMLRFIFIHGIGKASVEEVSFRDFIAFSSQEGWLS